ncbi:hypothetical protein PVA45_02840 [Entomospira entomophila]|uniref:Uncharacterized protein n=1 Tax=Entomospira entomophila TaxID=2719988 RepID=A0A968GBR6_9SPIO|nr:hypothetical protein [Entomospira entomophilus]NIZ40451.1 hypothetical protein [Entomospira entomophilus]WDI36009.1 hypothetical protein PVA45_02840 [Entomospira entomophilus]
MELLEIKDVQPEANAVYYRQKYDAKAHFRSNIHGDLEIAIHFIVETDPLGQKKISVLIKDSVDYPIIPLIWQVKERVLELHNNGHLY